MKILIPMLLLSLSLFLSGGCASNTYYDAAKPHHTEEGFKNNYSDAAHSGFLSWKWDQFWDDLPKPPEGGRMPLNLKDDRQRGRPFYLLVIATSHATLSRLQRYVLRDLGQQEEFWATRATLTIDDISFVPFTQSTWSLWNRYGPLQHFPGPSNSLRFMGAFIERNVPDGAAA